MLSDQAMIATVEIKTWNARAYDDAVTKEVAQSKGTSPEAGRYNKVLMPGEPMLAEIKTKRAAVRAYHYKNTLPWTWKGGQLLPTTHFVEYSKKIAELVQEFDDAVDAFCDPTYYNNAIDNARITLGTIFDASLYPSAHDIKKHFYCAVDYAPCPNSGDFRVDCQTEEIQRLKDAWNQKEKEIAASATESLWEKLSDMMHHAQERLSDPSNVFRDTLPKNIKEFTDILDKLNIEGDIALADVGRQAAVLGNLDPQALRDDPDLREDAAELARNAVDKINKQMAAFND
jgi:hypothetical protein